MTPPGATVSREFAAVTSGRLRIVRGQGARLWDEAGRPYVDLGATHGVGNLGANHPEVVRAIETQARELIYLGSGYASPVRTVFIDRLLSLLPPSFGSVFLSNSGTEAVEAAIKIARSATRRPQIVSAWRGFHGRTMGALSATWRRDLKEPFEPLVPEFVFVPFNDAAALDAAVTERTALVLLEPVQGEGGVHVASPEFLRSARIATQRAGALLAFDEVQTGLGRTGRTFAFERWGVVPDLLLLAKSLAGGLPIGATVVASEVVPRFRGTHHSTFGGSPLVCAAALSVLDVLARERLPERAERLGTIGLERLRSLPGEKVREVRGLGLMIGVEFRQKVAPYLAKLESQGFLAISAGSAVMRLLPPLVIADEDWASGLTAIAEVVVGG